MPRIREEKKSSAELNEQLDNANAQVEVNLHKDDVSQPKAPEKKEPNWTLWYVVAAVGVFALGILVICLINYFVEGSFSL